jgi:hypothetical protein
MRKFCNRTSYQISVCIMVCYLLVSHKCQYLSLEVHRVIIFRMKLLVSTALFVYQCEAFSPPARSFISLPHATVRIDSVGTRLHGINEWRDQALESKYTLDSYNQSASSSAIPATIPILPFPFSDVLLQGQRTQLNLYERRFHELFQDAMDNHCGMVGMGLLAGNGMITTLPLCEVESFSRFGGDENWVDRGNGMGNGSIFVTIRAVGRAKIFESDLLQEGPYMKARVVELVDEDVSLGGGSGLKERVNGKLNGESSPLEVASLVAGNIENLILSLASMEHKLKAAEERNNEEKRKSINSTEQFLESAGWEAEVKDNEDEVMNRRIGKYTNDFPMDSSTYECTYSKKLFSLAYEKLVVVNAKLVSGLVLRV